MKTSKFTNLFERYDKCRQEIGELFSCTRIEYNINEYTQEQWIDHGQYITLNIQGDDWYSMDTYGDAYEYSNYIMYVTEDGCGNSDMIVLDKRKRIDNEQAE